MWTVFFVFPAVYRSFLGAAGRGSADKSMLVRVSARGPVGPNGEWCVGCAWAAVGAAVAVVVRDERWRASGGVTRTKSANYRHNA